MPVVEVNEYSDTVPEGLVIRQEPLGDIGEMVFGGETVTIYVSLGPEPVTPASEINVNLAVYLGGRVMRRPRRY